jgi:hypothetical protein
MPVILANQKAEIRRIRVWSQPKPIVCVMLTWKNPSQNRVVAVTQDGGLEDKSKYCKINRAVSGGLCHKPLKGSVLPNSLYICKCYSDYIEVLMCIVWDWQNKLNVDFMWLIGGNLHPHISFMNIVCILNLWCLLFQYYTIIMYISVRKKSLLLFLQLSSF